MNTHEQRRALYDAQILADALERALRELSEQAMREGLATPELAELPERASHIENVLADFRASLPGLEKPSYQRGTDIFYSEGLGQWVTVPTE